MNFSSWKFALVFFPLLALPACVTKPSPQDRVCFKRHCFSVEIADNERARERGLQGRSVLSEKSGMLFIFSESQPYRFWMKDTLIPLDIIWLDGSRRVVHIEANAQPCRKEPCPNYAASAAARYVLELNSGMAQRIGLRVGGQMIFRLTAYLKKSGDQDR